MSEFIEKNWKVLAAVGAALLFILFAPWWLTAIAVLGVFVYRWLTEEIDFDLPEDDEDEDGPDTPKAA